MSVSAQILVGDCREVLRGLPDCSVQCVVTSPPYYGLRDYGVDGQIGLERTYPEFIAEMVAVFREVKRVLRSDETLWLNLGDSYAANAGATEDRRGRKGNLGNGAINGCAVPKQRSLPSGSLKPKDLMGVPWRVAFALQDDGWYLRSDIIWHKPNPMPESVTDRPTKAHEYIFLLTKSANYFYDHEAIAEPAIYGDRGSSFTDEYDQNRRGDRPGGKRRETVARGGFEWKTEALAGDGRNAFRAVKDWRNKRSVWTVGVGRCKEAHFATYPPALIRPCILAGSRAGDVVLDPFGGSGTTGMVSLELGRSAILIELNPQYAELCRRRCSVTVGLGL